MAGAGLLTRIVEAFATLSIRTNSSAHSCELEATLLWFRLATNVSWFRCETERVAVLTNSATPYKLRSWTATRLALQSKEWCCGNRMPDAIRAPAGASLPSLDPKARLLLRLAARIYTIWVTTYHLGFRSVKDGRENRRPAGLKSNVCGAYFHIVGDATQPIASWISWKRRENAAQLRGAVAEVYLTRTEHSLWKLNLPL